MFRSAISPDKPSQVLNVHHFDVDVVFCAIQGEKPEPIISRSILILMPAADKVRSNLINLILQGFRMKSRVVCGLDHFPNVFMPLAKRIEAFGVAVRWDGDTSAFRKIEVIFDETGSRVLPVLFDLFSFV